MNRTSAFGTTCVNLNSAFLLLCFIILAIPLAAMAGSCPENMIAYWNLDEGSASSYDDSISGLDATCINCPAFVPDGAVKGRNAQEFDGLDDILYILPNAMFDWSGTDRFSIELWMHCGPTNNDSEVLIARKNSTSSMEWKIVIKGDGTPLFSLADHNGITATLTSSKKADNNVWHHIAAVHNGTEIQLYLDGELQSSSATRHESSFDSATAPITIGGMDDVNPRHFSGLLDEVAIYNTNLDPVDIRTHYYLSRQYCNLFDSAVRIMPLGDSITDDNQTETYGTSGNGYRKPLWDYLNQNLFWVDFIGSRKNQTEDFDNEHAGFPGITDDNLAVLLESGTRGGTPITPGPYLDTYPADVILLHIGTNGLDEDDVTGVQNILDQIDAADSRTTVILARILDRIPWEENSKTTQFNNAVEAMALPRISAGDKIIMVDMEKGAGLLYQYEDDGGDFVDYLHPNDHGYELMADLWYTELNNLLPKVTETPTITSSPITTANKGQVYTYDVQTTGTPAPIFELSAAPAGMTVDQHSGLIQWTPDATGEVSVTVTAINTGADWGKDTQNFQISVNAVPEAAADAYVVDQGGTLTQAVAEGVLINDSDEDGDPLTAVLVSPSSSGTLDLNSDGSFEYVHNGNENTTDTFTYKVSDGKAESLETTVTIAINPNNNNPSGGGSGGGCFIQSLK